MMVPLLSRSSLAVRAVAVQQRHSMWRSASPLSKKVESVAFNKKLSSSSKSNVSGTSEQSNDVITLSTETHMKNAALATSLVAFCFGVAWYSMRSVGQAGRAGDDPLATLRQEASEAQEEHDRQNRSADEAAQMLKKFQEGEYDPDKYEEEESDKPMGRPWWKFW